MPLVGYFHNGIKKHYKGHLLFNWLLNLKVIKMFYSKIIFHNALPNIFLFNFIQ